VEKILVYGSILDEKRFQWISDIDLALSGKKFSFREQLRILSLLEEVFGEDGFDARWQPGSVTGVYWTVQQPDSENGVERFIRTG
jgi:hypothetical protein